MIHLPVIHLHQRIERTRGVGWSNGRPDRSKRVLTRPIPGGFDQTARLFKQGLRARADRLETRLVDVVADLGTVGAEGIPQCLPPGPESLNQTSGKIAATLVQPTQP